jgi:zinc carboxypeptidase
MMSSIRQFALITVVTLLPFGLCAQQQIDQPYTDKILEFTTDDHFLTTLVDRMPASSEVPSPLEVNGYIAGAEGHLTYAADVHKYMRELEKASPRVRVFTQGQSEEGRETILVVISDEANLERLDHYRNVTAQLADPRKISEEEAQVLIEEGLPFYWASGALHSPETGSPEMMMELAYRLAVEERPFFEEIRKNSIVMLTPALEVDGRERQVDLWNYQKANPGKAVPPLVYWGKYVVHDNNRDGLGLGLSLSRIVLNTFFKYHPQVVHDLHESIPFLYTSTGTGPYNAWLDPIAISEWQKLAYHEVEAMSKFGVPGVWTHGFYNGWGANYMMIAAHGHNSVGRFYETFGNRTPETLERKVDDRWTSRVWYRPNPPLKKVMWSLRNNVNLQQSALLTAMNFTARNREEFLENFWLKSSRSVRKAENEGPAAWVLPADEQRPLAQANLLNLLGQHGVEVHRLDQAITEPEEIPAGSYVVRMDQPYSRMGDLMLDRQFYDPDDNRPYDDTGWTAGPLRNVKTVRIVAPAILDAPMSPVATPLKVAGGVSGDENPAGYVIGHRAETAMATLRFRLPKMKILAAEKDFEIGETSFAAGSYVIPVDGNGGGLRVQLTKSAEELGLQVVGVSSLPEVGTHAVATPRIALVHTWSNTQSEGWVRIALDRLEIPYDYVSVHELRDTEDLRSKYDVILLGPTRGSPSDLVNGIPLRGDPIPWKGSDVTPNIASSPDQSDDIRGGIGLGGMIHVKEFVEAGGLFITIGRNSSLPIDFGLVSGVSIKATPKLKAQGSIMNAAIADKSSPITYGYSENFAIYFSQSPVFEVSMTGGMARRAPAKPPSRKTGRGSKDDPDIPQGRPYVVAEEEPEVEPGEELPLEPYMLERYQVYLPTPEEQPRVVLRFAEAKELLVSGMLGGGDALAKKPAVVDVPVGDGHYVMFANNPVWRVSTQGSYSLLFNAMLHFDHLSVGRDSEEE